MCAACVVFISNSHLTPKPPNPAVWPVYDTLLYAYVPASHRPLFNTFMSILWGG